MLTDGLRFLEGSTNTNLVLPVVTSAGKAALSANAGEVVFQSDGTKGLYVYDGIQWVLGIDISAATSPIAASRLPAFTGDVTSTAGTSALTLAASGVTAGTFKSVTVNAKGLVTAGTNPTTLAGYGITDAATNVATSITSGTFDAARLPAFTGGDVTAAAGSTALVLANSGVTAGTFKSVTVTAKGLVTAGTNPTTLSGYGITNAYTKTEVDTALTNATGGVVTFASVTAKPTTISGYGILDAYTKTQVDTAITNATPVLTFASLTGKPTTLAGYGITDGVLSTDVRLTDARTPLAHTHVIADVTDLQTSLDAKVTKNTDIVAGTAFKITYDAKGLVTAGAALTSTDIPALSTDAITSGVFDATRLPTDVVYTVAGALPSALVPTVSLTGTITPNTYADLTAATAASATGTVGIVTADSDLTKNGTYVKGTDGTWKKLNVATNNVASINGKTGNIAKILPEDILGVFDTDVNKTLLSAKLPLFTGDVVSTSGARSTLTLNTIPGLTVGANYSSVTVNAKGLVTGGIVGNNYTTVQADAKFVTKTAAGEKNAANGYLGLNATGKIEATYLPLFDGDVASTAGARNILTLKNISGLAAGTYSSVTVNAKGLVTGGTNGVNYTKVEADAKFLTKAVAGGRNVAEGFAGLNSVGKIDSAFLPAITVNEIQSVTTIVERDALTGLSVGDMAIVGGSVNKTFILSSVSPNTWVELLNPVGGVTSINGNSGVVTIDLSNIPGTLAPAKMPVYTTGDVVTNVVSNDLELKTINGLTAGSYTKVTVNTKGIVTAGTNPTTIADFGITNAYTKTEVDTAITNATPVLTFASLTGKPTTLSGYGITDTVATLENGKIPSSQLPSFVDDVQEFANLAAFPATGETGKIYVALDTNLTWRWSGSVYLQVSGPTTDASVLVGGTLNALRLPAFTGDVTSTAGTSALTLANSGVTAGTYNSVTVNAKGIVTAAGQSAASKDLSTARTITLSENLMLTDTSKHIQTIITTQPGLEVILPDATNFPIGGIHFVIKNDGYMTFNVADRIGNWICEVRPSSSVAVLLSNNTKNQYNYTENSVAKTGYAGEWVTVIGNATRPSGLIIGDETRLVSSTITNVGATPLSLTNAIVTYVTGNVAYVALLSNSQLVNTIATPVSLGAVTNSTIQIEALSSSIALVTYQTSAGVKVSKLSYDGTTLTVASTATVYNNTAVDHKLVKVSTTSAVVSYVAAANSLKLLTISDALTLGTVNTFGTIGNEFDITFNNNKLLLVYLDTNLKSSVGTISSGVITFGASTDVTAYAVSKIHLISTDTNANLCAFYHSTGFVEYVQLTMDTYDVNSVSTNVIFVGDIVKVKGAYVSDIALTSTYNKNVVLSYKTTNGKLEIVDITINANTVSVNNINTLVNSNGGTVEVIALYEDSIICVYSGLYDFLYVV